MRERITARLAELVTLEQQLQEALSQLAQRLQQTQANLLRVQGAKAELEGLVEGTEEP